MNNNSNKSLYIKSCFINNDFTFDGVILSTATGFLVKFNKRVYLVTNRHVVTGRDLYTNEPLEKSYNALPNYLVVEFPYEIELSDKGNTFWSNPFRIKLYKEDLILEDDRIWLEHPEYRNRIDVVAIDVTDDYEYSMSVLKCARNCNFVDIPLYDNIDNIPFTPKVTDEAYVVGYPYGYSTTIKRYLPIWSGATIASEYEENLTIPISYYDEIHKLHNKIAIEIDPQKRKDLEKKISEVYNYEAPTFLIDSKTRAGQSGSPVLFKSPMHSLQEDYYLIGIYSGRVNETSDLGYVWKVELIKEILENGV